MNKNYNYIFIFYDIKKTRVHKVFKICKKYCTHYQKSVFRGIITPSNILTLKDELSKVVVEGEDFVSIIKFFNEESFGEDILGKKFNKYDTYML